MARRRSMYGVVPTSMLAVMAGPGLPMDRHVCLNCEHVDRSDEEEPICPKCGGTMVSTIDKRESLRMIEYFMKWSESVDVSTALETLLFLTVVEAKNRGVPAAFYMRQLVEKWQEVDVYFDRREIAEA